MTQQQRIYEPPLWINDDQVPTIAAALKSGDISGIYQKLARKQSLVEVKSAFQEHAGNAVILWGKKRLLRADAPSVAIASFPNGQLDVATKGGLLLVFKDCCPDCGGDPNAALLATSQQQFQLFGSGARAKMSRNPQFRIEDSDLAHFATHMINKPHKCGGLEAGPGGQG